MNPNKTTTRAGHKPTDRISKAKKPTLIPFSSIPFSPAPPLPTHNRQRVTPCGRPRRPPPPGRWSYAVDGGGRQGAGATPLRAPRPSRRGRPGGSAPGPSRSSPPTSCSSTRGRSALSSTHGGSLSSTCSGALPSSGDDPLQGTRLFPVAVLRHGLGLIASASASGLIPGRRGRARHGRRYRGRAPSFTAKSSTNRWRWRRHRVSRI
jgi:hypothetical protein